MTGVKKSPSRNTTCVRDVGTKRFAERPCTAVPSVGRTVLGGQHPPATKRYASGSGIVVGFSRPPAVDPHVSYRSENGLPPHEPDSSGLHGWRQADGAAKRHPRPGTSAIGRLKHKVRTHSTPFRARSRADENVGRGAAPSSFSLQESLRRAWQTKSGGFCRPQQLGMTQVDLESSEQRVTQKTNCPTSPRAECGFQTTSDWPFSATQVP